MIDIFLVDDDTAYADSLKMNAMNEGIDITSVTDLNMMKTFLPKVESSMSVIILDIKGKFSTNDEIDDESFLAAAITYLDSEYPYKPRVILTGDTEGYKHVEKFRKVEKLFRKDNVSEASLFKYLKEVHNDLPIFTIKKIYNEIFEIFEKAHLPSVRKEELIDIILNKDSNVSLEIKKSLGRIRDIQEDIMRNLNSNKSAYLPDSKAHNTRNEISFTMSSKYLKQNRAEYMDYISNLADATYKTCCAYVVHTDGNTESTSSGATKYTVNSALNALFDLILWYASVVE